MEAAKRREKILGALKSAVEPMSAAALAAKFSVSRQVIVGDVALLRAAGAGITATPRGYTVASSGDGYTASVACVHGMDGMERELQIMVDNGCTVINVIVEHPVYGQLTGELRLKSRHDVGEFMEKVREYGVRPLSALTDGVHLHMLSCPDEAAFIRTRDELREAGLIYGE